jgi:hypothetical protein
LNAQNGVLFAGAALANPRVMKGYREKGYIAQPIPTPISKKRISDHRMYLIRSLVRRRLKNPNTIEISSAKSTIA